MSVTIRTVQSRSNAPAQRASRRARSEPALVRWIVTGIAILFLTAFLVLPLIVVFQQALVRGFGAYFGALTNPDALAAIRLTLLVAFISVSLNLVFGLIAAWAI